MFFIYKDTAPPQIYTLSLHDALPISGHVVPSSALAVGWCLICPPLVRHDCANTSSLQSIDRKSTRLNSSHQIISYAVFCLKKKNPKSHDNFCFSCPVAPASSRDVPHL